MSKVRRLSLYIGVALLATGLLAAAGYANNCHGAPASDADCHATPAATASPPATPKAPPGTVTVTGTIRELSRDGTRALLETKDGLRVLYLAPRPKTSEMKVLPALKVGDRVTVVTALIPLSVSPAIGGETARLTIEGIMCGECVDAVRKALAAVPGVDRIEVGPDGAASIGYDPSRTTVAALVAAVAQAKHPHPGMGFTAQQP